MRVKISLLAIIIFILNLALLVVVSQLVAKKLSAPRPVNLPVYDETLELTQGNFASFHTQYPKKGLLIYIADTQNDSVTEQARKFAKLSYYVILLDAATINTTLEQDSNPCKNFAAYLKDLSQTLKQHWQMDTKVPSLMIGQDQGSAIAFVALAQSARQDYHAVLSLNFEPKLKDSNKSLCGIDGVNFANGAQEIPPITQLPSSWYLFQETEVSESFDALAFSDKIPNARLTQVTGANARGEKNTALSTATQILQWLDPRLIDQLHTSGGNGDLPLIEIPVPTEVVDKSGTTMAFIVTGDGGWAEIDKNLALHLSQHGIPTVALDSLSYFWKPRSPEETTHAIETTIKSYLAKWHKDKVILIGYSFGADLLPVVANQFSAQTQHHVAQIALLGLGKSATFEFRLSSWLNADDSPNRIPLSPELQKLKWIQPLCVYGLKDKLTQCPTFEADGVKLIGLPGNHHFDKKYEDVVNQLIANLPK